MLCTYIVTHISAPVKNIISILQAELFARQGWAEEPLVLEPEAEAIDTFSAATPEVEPVAEVDVSYETMDAEVVEEADNLSPEERLRQDINR